MRKIIIALEIEYTLKLSMQQKILLMGCLEDKVEKAMSGSKVIKTYELTEDGLKAAFIVDKLHRAFEGEGLKVNSITIDGTQDVLLVSASTYHKR